MHRVWIFTFSTLRATTAEILRWRNIADKMKDMFWKDLFFPWHRKNGRNSIEPFNVYCSVTDTPTRFKRQTSHGEQTSIWAMHIGVLHCGLKQYRRHSVMSRSIAIDFTWIACRHYRPLPRGYHFLSPHALSEVDFSCGIMRTPYSKAQSNYWFVWDVNSSGGFKPLPAPIDLWQWWKSVVMTTSRAKLSAGQK